MKLVVRYRFDHEMKDDMVGLQVPEITSRKVHRLTALDDKGKRLKTRYVRVIRTGGLFCDYKPYFDEHPDVSPEPHLYADSIFMDDATRGKLLIEANHQYEFVLRKAGLYGNLRYFLEHPDRYPKLLAWGSAIGLLLAILGYSLKDWIATYF